MNQFNRNVTRAMLLLTATAVLAGCAALRPPSTVVTQPGRNAWYAQRGVLVFEAIVDGATGLNKLQQCSVPPGATAATDCRSTLSDANTRIVLDVSRRSVVTLGKAPEGWRVTLSSGLAEIRSKLDSNGKTRIAEWLALGEALLKEGQ